MANKLYEESSIQSIANAIRAKGQTGTMTVAQMAGKIAAISPTLQNKTVNPATSQQVVQADSDYDGLNAVTITAIQTEDKTATPAITAQDITPTSGKFLKKVHVNAVDVSATATEATVPAGVTFFANTLTRKTGTAIFPTVTQDSITKILTIS